MLSMITYPLIFISYFRQSCKSFDQDITLQGLPAILSHQMVHPPFFFLGWQSQDANGKFLKDIFWHLALDGLLRQLGLMRWKNFWAVLIMKWLLGLLNVFSPSALWKWNYLHVMYCQTAQRCRSLYSWKLQMCRVNWICCPSTRHVDSWVVVVMAAVFHISMWKPRTHEL